MIKSYIDNEELNYLYNGAFALIYPSKYEGFGIPILEAQKAGCPVLAYCSSSIPEVMGDSSYMLKTHELNEAIYYLDLLRNPEIRNVCIDKGLLNAKRFNWDKMYNELLALYQEAWEKNIHKKTN